MQSKLLKIKNIFPLTPMQEGMLFHSLLDRDSSAYFEQMVYDLSGELDVDLFRKSFNVILERYDILRTVFLSEKVKQPMQVVLKEQDADIHFEDISSMPEKEKPAYTEELKKKDRTRGFDLSKDSLMRISILKLDESLYKVIWSHHHIILDGWCIGIIMKEFFQAYRALKYGKPLELSKVHPYSDYLLWLKKQDREEAGAFWSTYLEDYSQQAAIPGKGLKLSGKGLKPSGYVQERLRFRLDEGLTAGLQSLAVKEQATINTLFRSIWGIILQRYNNADDVVFGSVVSGRPIEIPGVETMVGLFINTVPVRVKSDGTTTFSGLVKQVQEMSVSSKKYEYYPLAQIQSHSELKQNLIDHIVIFENYPIEKELGSLGQKHQDPIFNIKGVEIFEQTNYDFTVMVYPGSELEIEFVFNSLLYDKNIIERLAEHFKGAAKQAVENPDILVTQIEMLNEEEKRKILVDFNNTKVEYPEDKTINELFEEQVERTPEKTALVFKDKSLTYRELNSKANALARKLRDMGVAPGGIVAVIAERSTEMLTGIMAVLKAGGAYLPIDPTYPLERINYMLEDSKTGIVLKFGHDISNPELTVLDMGAVELYEGDASNLPRLASPRELAYVIYTSGSTGKPKGVMLEHRGVTNFIKGITDIIDFEQHKTILALTTISFDIFVLETLLPLAKGLGIIIADEEQQMDPKELNSVIVNNNIDMLQITPSRIRLLMSDPVCLSCLGNLSEIMVGGEALPDFLLEELKKHTRARIYNMYGPTETTVWSAVKDLTYSSDVNIGRPIANTQVYILHNNRLQPPGAVGELYIAGKGLARGYLNRPELTEEKFVPNPFIPGEMMYRTGDLARWLPTGDIDFLGRVDNQVKVRGFRIELGEIENQLLSHETVREAVVAAVDDAQGNKLLCAYLVCNEVLQVPGLKDYLSGKLPEYMVPSIFIQLEKMPLTPNGKIDRKSLPQATAQLNAGMEYQAPRNETERALARIWGEILGIEKVDIHSNFFNLGGHSITMMQVVSKISQELKVRVSLKDFMERNTVAKLAELLSKDEKQNGDAIYPVVKPDPENLYKPFPLTDVQMSYLLGRSEDFEMGGVSTHIYYELETGGDIQGFNCAMQKLIKVHPMLRAIVLPDGTQQILKEVPEYRIEVKDISLLSPEEQNQDILIERQRMSHYIFKTDRWPLFEIKALKLSGSVHYLFVGMDMLIADGASMFIMQKDFSYFYMNPNAELPEIGLSFRDYIFALKEFKNSSIYAAHKKYWLSKLDEFPDAPALPLKRKPEEITKPHFKRFDKLFDREAWSRLKGKALKYNITPSALVCTAYAQVLAFWSNQPRIGLNLTVFNRYPFHEAVNSVVGDFTSVLLLDIDLKPGKSFWENAKGVQDTLMEALEHRHYDGIEFIREIARHKSSGGKALMPVVFTSMILGNMLEEGEGKTMMSGSQTSQVYIDSQAVEANGRLNLQWDFVEELFEHEVIERMFEQYTGILSSLLETGEECKLELSAGDGEILKEYNLTDEDIEPETLHGMLQRQALKTPGNTAVIFGDESITYEELDKRSNQIAHYLIEKGVKPGELTGILAQRCIDTIVNLVGILKAGAAYVPVDPEYPDERKDYILENSGCKLLLKPGLYLENNLSDYPVQEIFCKCSLDNIAYVIYTSGSTGKPKGVVITHRAVSNTIKDINAKFNVNEDDRIIGLSSMCFDLSVYDIFGALSTGAALVLIQDVRDMENLADTIGKYGITIWNSVPAIMDMMLENISSKLEENDGISYWNSADMKDIVVNADKNDTLRLVLLSGDWIPMQLPEKITDRFPYADVVSLGGATEASIWSIYHPITEIREEWKSIPYGRPLANQNFYVLNYEMDLCPVGVPGELCIGGVGLAVGYRNDSEKTQKAFMTHPVLGSLYRTGDYGVLHREGYIEFLGRKDSQVKIRGHRIELGEIENRLLEHESVINTVVAVRKDSKGGIYLCAYLVSNRELGTSELREHLKRTLPDYMIPSYFVRLECIPLTPNGKVDRKTLPEPEGGINTGVEYAAPRNEIEQKLAEIWKEILEIDNVGINDEFFALGGDSLKAVKAAKQASDQNMGVSIADIYKYRTIASILQNRKQKQTDVPPPKPKEENEGSSAPAANAQSKQPSDEVLSQDFPEAKELEIVIQRDITNYVHRAAQLCMILKNPKLHPWFYEHYINIFSRTTTDGRLILDYMEVFAAHRDMICEYRLSPKIIAREPDFVQFIIEKINEGFYLFVQTDDFYLPGKLCYQKKHYILPNLLYGYDNAEQTFKCLGFDNDTGGLFTEMKFRYADYIEAYEQGKLQYKELAPTCLKTSVILYDCYEYDGVYPFSMNRFLNELKNYLSSAGNDSIIYFWGAKGEVNYGFKAYDDVIHHLENLLQDKITISYHAIHLLHEHKKLLAQRFKFIMDRYKLEAELSDFLNKYSDIVALFNKVRLKFFDLSNNLSTSEMNYSREEIGMIIKEMIEIICSTREKERIVLLDIYGMLKTRFEEYSAK